MTASLSKNPNKNIPLSPQPAPVRPTTVHKGWREVQTAIWIGLGLYFMVALLTWSPLDPGWSRVSSDTMAVSNAAGVAGCWIADILHSFIGNAALLIPVFCLFEVHAVWRPRAMLMGMPLRWMCNAIALVAAAALLALHDVQPDDNIINAAGGIVGLEIGQGLYRSYGLWAGTGLLLAVLVANISLVSRFSWSLLLEALGYFPYAILLAVQDGMRKKSREYREHMQQQAELQRAMQRAEDQFKLNISNPKVAEQIAEPRVEPVMPVVEDIPVLDAAAEPVTEPAAATEVPQLMAELNEVIAGFDVEEKVAASAADHPAESPATGSETPPSHEPSGHPADAFDDFPTLEEEPAHAVPAASEALAVNRHITQEQPLESQLDEAVVESVGQLMPTAAAEAVEAAVPVLRETHPEPLPVAAESDEDDSDLPVDILPELHRESVDVPADEPPFTPDEPPVEPRLIDDEDDEDLDFISREEQAAIDEMVGAMAEHPEEVTEFLVDEDAIIEPKPVAPPTPAPAPSAPAPLMPPVAPVALTPRSRWTIPSLDLLEKPDFNRKPGFSPEQLERLSRLLEIKLKEFNIDAKVMDAHPGPVITRFEIDPAPGTKVAKITNIAKDLARSMAMISVRVVEVIPGKPFVGIEIPNANREIVRLLEILAAPQFQERESPVTLALGKDIGGKCLVADLARMPHLLVAGTTGSGKSVGVNAMLLSILYKATPDEVRLILIDPKMLELSIYDKIPHLLTPVVTDMKDAANALRWSVGEMERRYKLMAAVGVRNLAGFNKKLEEAEARGENILDPLWKKEDTGLRDTPPKLEKMPFVVIVIDEFADMMMIVGKKVEELIARIAQKARAAGIHLILATQRPSVDVITGLIKANVPSRIAFQVSSKIDSRTILDQGGAEQLLGHGDMLFQPVGTNIPERVHGAFVSDEEVHKVCDYWRAEGEPQYVDEILEELNEDGTPAKGVTGGMGDEDADAEQDPLYDDAVAFVLETRRASISFVQRKFKIGYNRAARLIEAMEMAGLVSPMQSNGQREIIVPHND